MGDHNERVHKRLRTVDTDSHTEQGPAQAQADDAEAFEHIKQGSEPYDVQTYGTTQGRLLLCSLSSVSAYAVCPPGVLKSHLRREGKWLFKLVFF